MQGETTLSRVGFRESSSKKWKNDKAGYVQYVGTLKLIRETGVLFDYPLTTTMKRGKSVGFFVLGVILVLGYLGTI